jgi:hypothetical protein
VYEIASSALQPWTPSAHIKDGPGASASNEDEDESEADLSGRNLEGDSEGEPEGDPEGDGTHISMSISGGRGES